MLMDPEKYWLLVLKAQIRGNERLTSIRDLNRIPRGLTVLTVDSSWYASSVCYVLRNELEEEVWRLMVAMKCMYNQEEDSDDLE
jgi:hypothetical protein